MTHGPAGVGAFGAVAKFIQHGRELDAQFAHTGTRHGGPLAFIFRAGHHNLVVDVGLHLPNIAGMGLENVNHQKRHPALVLFIKAIEGGNLPPEGRSSVAPEDQDHRLFRGQCR